MVLVPRMNFVKNSGLSKNQGRVLLAIKLLTGIAYSWMLLHYFHSGDAVGNNIEGRMGHEMLLADPVHFFQDWGQSNYQNPGDFFSAENSFWDDLSLNLLVKVLALLNFITAGDFLINAMLFSLLSFFGSLAIFRFFSRLGIHHFVNIVGSFLLLSTLVFTASLHKDSIVFFALGLFIYHFSLCCTGKAKATNYIILLAAWLLLLINRNYVAIIVIPPAIAFYLCGRMKFSSWKIYAAMIISIVILGAIWILAVPGKNPASVIATRQSSYLNLIGGNSDVYLPKLTGSLTSLITTIPIALKNVFSEPNPFHYINAFFLLFGIETWIYLLVMLSALLIYLGKPDKPRKELLFVICIALFAFLVVGLIVPNAGAILRYRSIYLPLILIPCLNKLFYTLK